MRSCFTPKDDSLELISDSRICTLPLLCSVRSCSLKFMLFCLILLILVKICICSRQYYQHFLICSLILENCQKLEENTGHDATIHSHLISRESIIQCQQDKLININILTKNIIIYLTSLDINIFLVCVDYFFVVWSKLTKLLFYFLIHMGFWYILCMNFVVK